MVQLYSLTRRSASGNASQDDVAAMPSSNTSNNNTSNKNNSNGQTHNVNSARRRTTTILICLMCSVLSYWLGKSESVFIDLTMPYDISTILEINNDELLNGPSEVHTDSSNKKNNEEELRSREKTLLEQIKKQNELAVKQVDKVQAQLRAIEKKEENLRKREEELKNQENRISQIPDARADSSPATPKQEKYAYVTAIHMGSGYLCGAAMLAWNLRNRRPDIDLVIFLSGRLMAGGKNDTSIDEHDISVEYLTKLGYKVYQKPILVNPFNADRGKNVRAFNFAKINMYSMIDYTKIVFVDADLFLPNGHLDRLFDMYEGSPRPAGREITPGNHINTGLVVLRPNVTLYMDMMAKFNKVESPNGGDQGFTNKYFNEYHGGFEFFGRDFPRQVSNLKKGPDGQWKFNPFTRPRPPKNYHVYHAFGHKPWKCNREAYCETDEDGAIKYLWPQMIDLWWTEFDGMAEKWPWLIETGSRFKRYCILGENPSYTSYSIPKKQFPKLKREYRASLKQKK